MTNLDHLLWAMLTRTDPKESIQFITNSWDLPADPRLSPEKRAARDMTHSVAIIDACKPFHWRDKFPPTNAPSPEVASKAREKFGYLLDGIRPADANAALPAARHDVYPAATKKLSRGDEMMRTLISAVACLALWWVSAAAADDLKIGGVASLSGPAAPSPRR